MFKTLYNLSIDLLLICLALILTFVYAIIVALKELFSTVGKIMADIESFWQNKVTKLSNFINGLKIK